MKNQFRSLAIALFVYLAILTGCGGGGGSSVPTTPPSTPAASVASFRSADSITSVVVGGTIGFIDTSTKSPTSWTWDFGDGGSSTLQNPSHTFNTVGTWQVKETVTGGSSATMVIVVTAAPVVVEKPTANFSLLVTTGVAPFIIAPVNTTTGNATNHLWTYGDGATSNLQNPPAYAYPATGTYTLSLTESNEGGSTTKSVTIVVTAPVVIPALPKVKAVGFPTIPSAEYTEAIVVAMNEDFTVAYPDWQAKAQKFIDHLNTVLMRVPGNRKQYTIAKFKTYKNSDLGGINSNATFYHDNNFTNGTAGGTTLFVYMWSNYSDVPPAFSTNSSSETTIAGKIYSQAWVNNGISHSILTDAAGDFKSWHPDYWYDIMAHTFVHELGHTLGLTADELYRYIFTDLNDDLPNLGYYDMHDYYPLDPMGYSVANENNMNQFSPINSALLNLNADHRYNVGEIIYAVPTTVMIKVIDAQGVAVVGAVVKSFGAVDMLLPPDSSNMKSVNMKTFLETLPTNSNGEVTLTNDFSARWNAKGIKASKAGKYAGVVLTLTDLQRVYILKDLSIAKMKGVGLDSVVMQGNESVTYVLRLQ